MKTWQFYILSVIGICLIGLTGTLSYSLYNLPHQITGLSRTGSGDTPPKRSTKYEYQFRALYKKDFYNGKEEPLLLPNTQKDLDFFGWDYAGTLFDDGRWLFILMKRKI